MINFGQRVTRFLLVFRSYVYS